MKKFIALLADTQLDKRLYGLEDTRQDWFNALKQAADQLYAQRDQLAAIAVLGDIFDTESIGSEAAYSFQSFLHLFKDSDIPILLILGNHDSNPNRPINWIHVCKLVNPNVVQLSFDKPFLIPSQGDLSEITVLGNNHTSRKAMSEMLGELKKPATTGEIWFFLHQALAELAPHKDAWDVQATQIPDWANRVYLGDFHNHAAFTDPRGIQFAYPGAIETVSFNQTEYPGYILFDRTKNTYQHVRTEQRDYLSFQLDSILEENWKNHLLQKIQESTKEHQGRKPIIRVFYPALKWEAWQSIRDELYTKCLKVFDYPEDSTPERSVNIEVENLPDTKEEVRELACKILDTDDSLVSQALKRVLVDPTAISDIQQELFPKAVINDSSKA